MKNIKILLNAMSYLKIAICTFLLCICVSLISVRYEFAVIASILLIVSLVSLCIMHKVTKKTIEADYIK